MKRIFAMAAGLLALGITDLTAQSNTPIPLAERSDKAGKRPSDFQFLAPKLLQERGPAGTASFTRSARINSRLKLTITSSPKGLVAHPKSVVLAPGQKILRIPIKAIDNKRVDIDRKVVISVVAGTLYSASAEVALIDDDQLPEIRFETPPSSKLQEGGKGQRWRLSLDQPISNHINVALAAHPDGELQMPSKITIKRGETGVNFDIYAKDDSLIDGTKTVTITAKADRRSKSISKTIVVVDNEERVLRLYPKNIEIAEGEVAEGVVSSGNNLASNLRVDLSTSDNSALKIPSYVIIPAGKASASFSISAIKDPNNKADRKVNISATAATFITGQIVMDVMDRDPAEFQFKNLPLTVRAGSSFTTQVRAMTQSGSLLRNMGGVLQLELVTGEDKVVPLANSGTANPFWDTEIKTPSNFSGMARIRARHSSGFVTESPFFKILGADALDPYAKLSLSSADIIWDPGRKSLYSSVISSPGGIYDNHVVAIDPATREITQSVFIGSPGQLALTSDSNAIYVVQTLLNRISRIDLQTFKVGLEFEVHGNSLGEEVKIADICSVKDQPDLLLVSKAKGNMAQNHVGVSVYRNGIELPARTSGGGSRNRIEPSADPTLFYNCDYDSNRARLSHLRLVETGLLKLKTVDIGARAPGDIRADGNLLMERSGTVLDGETSGKLGTILSQGAFCPDVERRRIYALSPLEIKVHDSVHLSEIHSYFLPEVVDSPAQLIRWGESGLAFRTPSEIHLIHESNIVPRGSPANLSVSVTTASSLVTIGQPFQYTIRVRNHGPNPASGTVISASLSRYQSGSGAPTSSMGPPRRTAEDRFQLAAGDIAPGAEVVMNIPARLQTAAFNSCVATASSEVPDPDTTNNSAFKLISAKLDPKPDTLNYIWTGGESLVHDGIRGLLWNASPDSLRGVQSGVVVSINPLNGQISDPIDMGAEPLQNSMALSRNGQFLYVGLKNVPEIACLDLFATPKSVTRIPLPKSPNGNDNFAKDIIVLEGDGRSILVLGSDDLVLSVFDGLVQRQQKSLGGLVDDIAPSEIPGIHIGCKTLQQGFDLSRWQVSSSGVSEILHMNHDNGYEGFNVKYKITADKGFILTNKGNLINAVTLLPVRNLAAEGFPCLDVANQRAFLTIGDKLRCFDFKTGNEIGTFTLPWAGEYQVPNECIRWGTDGLALLLSGRLHLVRWSKIVGGATTLPALGASFAVAPPPPVGLEDADGDGIADVLEWLFGTSTGHPDPNPIRIGYLPHAGDPTLNIYFPRRAEVSASAYTIETSTDLRKWTEAHDVVEKVVATESINGVLIEKVSATLPLAPSSSRYVRIRWNP